MIASKRNEVLSRPRPALADQLKHHIADAGGSITIEHMDWSTVKRALERANPGDGLPANTALQDALDYLEATGEATIDGDHHRRLVKLV